MKTCLICGKQLEVKGKRKLTAKYCSTKCHGKSLRGKIFCNNQKGVCNNTGRTHFKKGFKPWNAGKKMSDELKLKLSLAHMGKMMGENHPNWRGGITPEIMKRINKPEWKLTRQRVYERDGFTCQVCQTKVEGKHIACHHKVPWRITHDDSLENLITVCKSCHFIKDITFRVNENRSCAYTIVDDRYFYPVGTHIFINTFRKFHPEIDLIVFRQDMIDKIFKKEGINFYMAKPYFGEIVANLGYKVVCNIDADTCITGRLTEIFDNIDYDVASVSNLNDYENASLENITPEMYLQAGMVASTKREFWLKWKEMNKEAMKYLRQENDILNKLVYQIMPELKLKIADKDKDYYGCKSLAREQEMYIEDDKLMLRGEQVRAYHHAHGAVFPKLDFDNMPFKPEVRSWLKRIAFYGQTEVHCGL